MRRLGPCRCQYSDAFLRSMSVSQSYDKIIDQLRESTSPIIQYKLRRYVQGVDPNKAEMRRLRATIKDSPIAKGLLQDLVTSDPTDGKTAHDMKLKSLRICSI